MMFSISHASARRSPHCLHESDYVNDHGCAHGRDHDGGDALRPLVTGKPPPPAQTVQAQLALQLAIENRHHFRKQCRLLTIQKLAPTTRTFK